MKQLTLQPGLSTQLSMTLSAHSGWVFSRWLLALLIPVIFLSNDLHAQTVTFPEIEIDGVDDDSSGSEILIGAFKWAARLVIWGIMGWAGIICLRTIIASWQEQKSKEAGRWSALVADAFGSVVMVMVVVLIGLWILSFIK